MDRSRLSRDGCERRALESTLRQVDREIPKGGNVSPAKTRLLGVIALSVIAAVAVPTAANASTAASVQPARVTAGTPGQTQPVSGHVDKPQGFWDAAVAAAGGAVGAAVSNAAVDAAVVAGGAVAESS